MERSVSLPSCPPGQRMSVICRETQKCALVKQMGCLSAEALGHGAFVEVPPASLECCHSLSFSGTVIRFLSIPFHITSFMMSSMWI